MEGGGRRAKGGGRRVEGGEWKVEGGGWSRVMRVEGEFGGTTAVTRVEPHNNVIVVSAAHGGKF